MINLEELKNCRIVKFNNHYYFVGYCGIRWYDTKDGCVEFINDSFYECVSVAYKTLNDFKNNKPFYTKNFELLSNEAKEWLKYIVRNLKNVNQDTLILNVYDTYCTIVFKTNNDAIDNFLLPNYENIIYDFTKLEKGKEYTFKELGIKL